MQQVDEYYHCATCVRDTHLISFIFNELLQPIYYKNKSVLIDVAQVSGSQPPF